MSLVNLQVTGLREAVQVAQNIGRRARDFSPWLRRVALPDFRGAQRDIFESQGAAGQFRWAPNTGRYAAWKRRTVGHTIVGKLTGKLREEMTTTGPYAIAPNMFAAWSSLPYAKYFHFGAGHRFSRGSYRQGVMAGVLKPSPGRAWLRTGSGHSGTPARPFIPIAQWWENRFGIRWALSLRDYLKVGG